MTAHLTDSDREALRLAHGLREEMRQALIQQGVASAPAVSPFVDSAGRPSVLVRMDAESAHVMALMLSEYRARLAAQPHPSHEAMAPLHR